MNDFFYENPVKVYFGRRSVESHLAEAIRPFGQRVLLAYGKGSIIKNGVYDDVTEALRKAGKTVIRFNGIMPNPTWEKVMEGVRLVKEEKIDFILAVGGGSVMDCSKAVALAARAPEDPETIWENYWEKAIPLTFSPVPVGCVVTVPGTGSEMNGEGVITHEGRRIKTSVNYHGNYPKFSILDPEYTFTVSPLQTACGGFDMLTHVMETYFSYPEGDNLSDAISEALMQSIVKNLPAAVREPENYEARSNLMWASSLAEIGLIKLGKSLDFEPHMIEHQMGAYTDCNHGAGLAVIYPAYYRHIAKAGSRKLSRAAEVVWGIDRKPAVSEEAARKLEIEDMSELDAALYGIDAMESFIRSVGLPSCLQELGIKDRSILPVIADSCIINTGGFRTLTKEEILQILEECW